MKQKGITEKDLIHYEDFLRANEKSELTIEKYLSDLRSFLLFVGDRPICKEFVVNYKETLGQRYMVSSANSKIASINSFLRFINLADCCVKQFKVQRKIYCAEEKELTKAEYIRLVETAKRKRNERLVLLLQTICGTGIRVSEVPFITAEAAQRGEAIVRCKAKTRTVIIVRELQKKLIRYCKMHGITTGPIFITKRGIPMSRTNIWREMKSLCSQAGVLPGKVFPHNLRHLFARSFYGIEKDIAKLADILGHSNINTTRIYIVTTGTEHRRKMESLRLIL